MMFEYIAVQSLFKGSGLCR